MAKILFLLLSVCASLAAQGFEGRWAGSADTIDASGVKRLMQQTIEFKGSGKDLTAQQIGRGAPIPLKVVFDDTPGKITLLRELDFEGGEHIRWHFEFKGDHIVGTIWSVHDAPKKWGVDWSGPIDLKRVTP